MYRSEGFTSVSISSLCASCSRLINEASSSSVSIVSLSMNHIHCRENSVVLWCSSILQI